MKNSHVGMTFYEFRVNFPAMRDLPSLCWHYVLQCSNGVWVFAIVYRWYWPQRDHHNFKFIEKSPAGSL